MPNSKEHILLVEGRDDREVVHQFCNEQGIDNRKFFAVEDKDGIEDLLDNLGVRPKTSEVKTLGAIIDADNHPSNRWQSIVDRLEPVGYSIPNVPVANGLILEAPTPSRPRLGIWLMPDNDTAGMLEDFLLNLVPENDATLDHAKRAVASISNEGRKFSDAHLAKAEMHTWLAWQKEPGTPLGLAITRAYLDVNRGSAPSFAAWLKELFQVKP